MFSNSLRICGFTISLVVPMLLVTSAQAELRITVDRNPNATANSAFRFKRVPSPVKDDAGATAKVTIVDGDPDPNGADVSALVDGVLPENPDEPRKNFFLNAGSGGGRIRMDLGTIIDVAQINSYSWHPNTRGPQVYKVWVSDGLDPKFNSQPRAAVDPATCGWKSIAIVDTRSNDEDDGGQFGVSVSNDQGSLGRFRYLLFDLYVTETADDSGNTFYSEIDVVARK